MNKTQQNLSQTFGLMNAPQAVPTEVITQLDFYKNSIRRSWETRRIQGMTQSHLAAICGFYAPHVSQWLSANDDLPDMPARCLPAFCWATGNLIPIQFLVSQLNLTLTEEVQANMLLSRSFKNGRSDGVWYEENKMAA